MNNYSEAFINLELIKGKSLKDIPVELISKSAHYSYMYALLTGRFELGETVIATDVEYSYQYAYHVIKGRFELGEVAIAASYIYSKLYNDFIERLNNE